MDVREKLVEMSEQLRYCADVSDCANCKRWDKVCENQCVDNLLLMAADLIDEVANGVTVQEWISVKDRFPEENTTVIASTDNGIVFQCLYAYDGWDLWEGNEVNITHWQPLPQPPKGE